MPDGMEVFRKMGHGHRPAFDHTEAAELFLAGATVRELADHYGVSEPTLRQALRRQGVNVRKRTRG